MSLGPRRMNVKSRIILKHRHRGLWNMVEAQANTSCSGPLTLQQRGDHAPRSCRPQRTTSELLKVLKMGGTLTRAIARALMTGMELTTATLASPGLDSARIGADISFDQATPNQTFGDLHGVAFSYVGLRTYRCNEVGQFHDARISS